jgi:glyoxylase-like metal-dependent hydrolase (beta-lactamase superfamily II)
MESCASPKLRVVLSFTPVTMLQASAQAVDFKVGRYFGEGQVTPPVRSGCLIRTNRIAKVRIPAYGQRDAILVDTFLSVQHSWELADWVVESGKNLTTIYITHAHGDHFFRLKLLLDRFPKATAFARLPALRACETR